MNIYFDSNATTALDPKVLAAIYQELQTGASNPSSVHAPGREAKARLILARDKIASYCGVKPTEITFTSGGTEGLNTLLKGLAKSLKGAHVISSDVEHSCVYNTLKWLEKEGVEVSFLSTGLWGAVKVEAVQEAIKPNTRLITLMAVNNETGVKTDLKSIAALAKSRDLLFIVDGVALFGKEPFEYHEGISAISFSAHKFHGPKGIGFNIIRKGLKLEPLLIGGSQEHERRGGTENLAGIMGLAAAIECLNMDAFSHIQTMREYFEEQITSLIPGITINGLGPRISNTSNIAFPGLDAETLLMQLDLAGIFVSHGSACSSGALEPSRVLLNMGLSRSMAKSCLRFSFSRMTTRNEIDAAVHKITDLNKILTHK